MSDNIKTEDNVNTDVEPAVEAVAEAATEVIETAESDGVAEACGVTESAEGAGVAEAAARQKPMTQYELMMQLSDEFAQQTTEVLNLEAKKAELEEQLDKAEQTIDEAKRSITNICVEKAQVESELDKTIRERDRVFEEAIGFMKALSDGDVNQAISCAPHLALLSGIDVEGMQAAGSAPLLGDGSAQQSDAAIRGAHAKEMPAPQHARQQPAPGSASGPAAGPADVQPVDPEALAPVLSFGQQTDTAESAPAPAETQRPMPKLVTADSLPQGVPSGVSFVSQEPTESPYLEQTEGKDIVIPTKHNPAFKIALVIGAIVLVAVVGCIAATFAFSMMYDVDFGYAAQALLKTVASIFG